MIDVREMRLQDAGGHLDQQRITWEDSVPGKSPSRKMMDM